jgi:hypothetical protein
MPIPKEEKTMLVTSVRRVLNQRPSMLALDTFPRQAAPSPTATPTHRRSCHSSVAKAAAERPAPRSASPPV